jgi:hypothetical protein
MIIDVIFERRNNVFWRSDRESILEYAKFFEFNYILDAIKTNNQELIKLSLKRYIIENGYSKEYTYPIIERFTW